MLAAALLLLQAAAAAAPPAAPGPTPSPVLYPDPSAEALALGGELAGAGTLASLLPMIAGKETEEMVAAHPELSAGEQAELRRTAAATMEAGRGKMFAAQARAYAERLSVPELRTLVAQANDPVTRRYRAALPAAIAATMGAMGGFDFKKDTLTAFCAKMGKACAK